MKSDLSKVSSEIEMTEKKSYHYDDGLPVDICKLPSKGKLYTKGHPLCDKEVVEFKSMTAHEENILATPALIRQGTVLNVLVASSLCDKDIDTESLLMGDKAALLVSIRISGFGKEYKAQTMCPSCKEASMHEFDLGNATIKELGAEPIRSHENLFEYKLPKSGKLVLFSLPTDGDDLEILRIQANRKKTLRSAIVDTSITDRLKLAIKSIDGNEDREMIAKFVNRMPALDSRKLRAYMASIEPDLLMKEEVMCRHCGASSTRNIPMGYEFFWPQDLI